MSQRLEIAFDLSQCWFFVECSRCEKQFVSPERGTKLCLWCQVLLSRPFLWADKR